jgi:hypothetical protein
VFHPILARGEDEAQGTMLFRCGDSLLLFGATEDLVGLLDVL